MNEKDLDNTLEKDVEFWHQNLASMQRQNKVLCEKYEAFQREQEKQKIEFLNGIVTQVKPVS